MISALFPESVTSFCQLSGVSSSVAREEERRKNAIGDQEDPETVGAPT